MYFLVLGKLNVIEFSKNKKLVVITRGEKGALAIKDEKVISVQLKRTLK